MDLSILIVNWNSADYLRGCLESLANGLHGLAAEILVLDNASRDGCGEMLAARFPGVRFVQSEVNLGFAKANNRLARESSGRALLLLNPDTQVLGPAIPAMLAALESQPDAGIVGCKLLNADGSIQESCVQRFPSLAGELFDSAEFAARGHAALWRRTGATAVDCVSGAAMMVRRTVFEAAGGFSEDYFMYVEDRDLCLKANRLGWRTYVLPAVSIVHYGGASAQSRPESQFEVITRWSSLLEFMRRRRGTTWAALFRGGMVLSALGRLAVLAILGRGGRSRDKWNTVLRWSLGLKGLAALWLLLAASGLAQGVFFADDFEVGDFSAWSGADQSNPSGGKPGCAVTAHRPHSGHLSFRAEIGAGGNCKNLHAFPATANVNVRFFFFVEPGSLATAGTGATILTVENGPQLRLLNDKGILVLRERSGVVGQTGISRGEWHSLEATARLAADGTGSATVRVDGANYLTATGLTTGASTDRVYLSVENFATATGLLYFDDVVLSASPVGAPAAGLTVRLPNTAARSAVPVDAVIYGHSPTDKLSARLNGVTVHEKAGPLSGRERFAVRIGELGRGNHSLYVSLSTAAGAEKAAYATSVTKYMAGIPAVSIDEHNNIWRGGSKFFSLSPFEDGVTKWQSWLQSNAVNTYGWVAGYVNGYAYHKDNYRSFLDSLNGAPAIGPNDNFTGRGEGVYAANGSSAVAIVIDYVKALATHPSKFMWTWKDEPDLGPVPGHVPPERMIELMEATHQNDAHHPVMLNLAGYPASNVRNRRSGWHYPIVPNSRPLVADVFAFDMYPLIYQARGLWNVTQWVEQLGRLRRYTYDLVPWYTFIEGGIQPCPNPPVCTGGYGPTPAQVNMEAWLAVIHGMKGISWWGPLAYIDTPRREVMARFAATATALKDVILSETARTVSSANTAARNRVDAMVKEDAHSIYVFAARLSDIGEQFDPPVTALLTVSDLGTTQAEVYGENRTVPVVNGLIADQFAACGVHIYRIPRPSSAAPAPPSNLTVRVNG